MVHMNFVSRNLILNVDNANAIPSITKNSKMNNTGKIITVIGGRNWKTPRKNTKITISNIVIINVDTTALVGTIVIGILIYGWINSKNFYNLL